MFVAPGARALIVAERRDRFREQYIAPLVAEASKLGISSGQLRTMIDDRSRSEEDTR